MAQDPQNNNATASRDVSHDEPEVFRQIRGEDEVIGMTRVPAARQGETDGDFARVVRTLRPEHREARLAWFQSEVVRGILDVPRVARGAIGGPATSAGDSQE